MAKEVAKSQDSKPVCDALRTAIGNHLGLIKVLGEQKAHFKRWRYAKIEKKLDRFIDRAKDDLECFQHRLEFYDERFDGEVRTIPWKPHDVIAIYQGDLAALQEMKEQEARSVEVCEAAGDYTTSNCFRKAIHHADKSIENLEARLRTIQKDIGLPEYLSMHMHDE